MGNVGVIQVFVMRAALDCSLDPESSSDKHFTGYFICVCHILCCELNWWGNFGQIESYLLSHEEALWSPPGGKHMNHCRFFVKESPGHPNDGGTLVGSHSYITSIKTSRKRDGRFVSEDSSLSWLMRLLDPCQSKRIGALNVVQCNEMCTELLGRTRNALQDSTCQPPQLLFQTSNFKELWCWIIMMIPTNFKT